MREPAMFRAVYESTWYNPVLFWIAGVALVLTIARRLPFLYGFLVVFAVDVLADVTLTSAWSPIPSGSRAATVVSVVFVILGDARYFLLVERARAGVLTPRGSTLAIALSLVVPIASYLPQLLFPSAFVDARAIYLTYEAMFFALAIGLRAWLPRRAWKRDADRRWALAATTFEIAQYGLWAIADVIILAGHDVGYALRLVPNTMYYALFLPFVAWSAPRDQWTSWRALPA